MFFHRTNLTLHLTDASVQFNASVVYAHRFTRKIKNREAPQSRTRRFRESILSAASKAQMWTPFTLNSGRSTGYGFGWAITSISGGKVVHHNGGGFGFNTGFYHFIDAGWSVIVLTNTLWRDGPRRPNNGDAIAREVAPLYDPRLTWPSRQKPSG